MASIALSLLLFFYLSLHQLVIQVLLITALQFFLPLFGILLLQLFHFILLSYDSAPFIEHLLPLLDRQVSSLDMLGGTVVEISTWSIDSQVGGGTCRGDIWKVHIGQWSCVDVSVCRGDRDGRCHVFGGIFPLCEIDYWFS